ncbi:MAG: vitamin K epoxide reductase family protein [Candidatus Micrarchaeales archaeon]|jgi:uncharacterized membrane protein|uniref:Vitamin K epoxide reductase n=1 Tax=Candidatus Micrarchaeum acidiphilum ARMAN-2 TaxID=425595 RepID=C7DIA8_MICA2|nr:MAG: Vitamin K epoxide reductase [Candidatus Micrarchaeum acidiphilum ARMAN-2]MCW6160933.1 vitamin K epoxide reductase family protein [Candidatus Micrarchaeales archaeon]
MFKWRNILIILLFLGLLVSVYLTIEHFQPSVLICPNTGIISCATVLTSKYSIILGIPLEIIVLAWFIIAMLISVYEQKISNKDLLTIWFMIGSAGVLYSFASQYLIGKICVYCMSLDAILILSSAIIFYNTIKVWNADKQPAQTK